MKELFSIVDLVVRTVVSVLIEGESVTGKELFTKTFHYNSSRKNRNFILINCSALSLTLLESEFLGYKKGTFTGAITSKRVVFEAVNGGTLFLDEIGKTVTSFQSKLLRVLEGEIKKKQFREDLFSD